MKNLGMLFIMALFALLISRNVTAEDLHELSVIESVGPYIEINTPPLNNADDIIHEFLMPFPFEYDGQSITKFRMSANGWVALNENNTGITQYPTSRKMFVSPFNTDLHYYNVGQLMAGVAGTAPKRILILQWRNQSIYGQNGILVNFQALFFEGSNIIEFRYGACNVAAMATYRSGFVMFAGDALKKIINIEPKAPASTFHYSNVLYDGTQYLKYTAAPAFTVGKRYTLKKPFPVLISATPDENLILARGNKFPAPVVRIERGADQPNVTIEYYIENKKTHNVIYRGTQEGDVTNSVITPNPQPVGEPGVYVLTHATGVGAAQKINEPNSSENNGMIDLQTNQASIPGGEYMIHVTMKIPSENEEETISQKIIIALEDDLAITTVTNPKPKDRKKYLIDNRVPLEIKVTNIGLNAINSFSAHAKIKRASDDFLMYERSKIWTNTVSPLNTGDFATIKFDDFVTNLPKVNIGDYKIEYEIIRLGGKDDELSNNKVPSVGQDPILFEVAYDIEPSAKAINSPVGNVYVNRPVVPKVIFGNNGLDDLSDVPVKIKITGPAPLTTLVYEDSTSIPDISSSVGLNEVIFNFPTTFNAPMKGLYTMEVELLLPYDRVMSNNIVTGTFTVIEALEGVYTIGTTNSGQTTNFPTIDAALDALYLQGISAPVQFVLTDAIYNVGDKDDLLYPALDLSSRITGTSHINTITFIPSDARAVEKGGVTINLKSGNGIGVYIAQNIDPENPNAAVKIVKESKIKEYANSAGYIKFDGKSQKSLKFVLDTDNGFRTAFYLGNGASNITIQNCLIKGGPTPHFVSSLPGSFKNTSDGFSYQDDYRTATNTYTAGIVMRSVAPIDKKDQSNHRKKLDTITNNFNKVMYNEISGFAYGVASMGTGYLFRAGGTNEYQRYYNKGNQIHNNKIFNVSRAGVFMGYEEATSIQGNRIYNVNNQAGDANGIILGGKVNDQTQGYNTMNMKIIGNEISNLKSSVAMKGILVEQSPLLLNVNGTTTIFPNMPEKCYIVSNAIWELEPTGANKEDVSRFGVLIRTERKNAEFTMPNNIHYSTRNDVVANNTIIMTGDQGVMQKAPVVAIGLQQTMNTVVKNNAIAMMDQEIDADNNINAAVLFHGNDLKAAGLMSDRNVYWNANNTSSVFRFIKTDALAKTVYAGTQSEYRSLAQWQNWTGQDKNSVAKNFVNDMTYTGLNPMNLRIKSGPYPLNSVLNNHGDRLEQVSQDIMGNMRGVAGQRFDIGAFEFNGRQFISDLEVLKISAPASYQSNMGEVYSDAEYIMTEAPVEVSALIRNNGSLQQTGNNATLKIYRENPDGTFATAPLLTVASVIELIANEELLVHFGLTQGANKFVPQTYSDLRTNIAYKNAVPDKFKNMTANVTPRYKLEVVLDSDEENNNNISTKYVRFFIRKAWNYLLVSSDFAGQTITATSPKDIIAGSLNHQALVEGLEGVGWKVIIDPAATSIADDRFDYDVLDRQNWEPRAVNYSIFRSLLWSDSHDQRDVNGTMTNVVLPYFIQEDIKSFMESGEANDKKNMIYASQELLRNNDAAFVNPVFRAADKAMNNTIDRTQISGSKIASSLKNTLRVNTGVAGDVDSDPALLSVFTEGIGRAQVAYYYTKVKPGEAALPEAEKLMAVSTVTIKTNHVYLGADWRHFGNVESMLRQIFDYVERNGGIVFPIELLSFDANLIGSRVNLNWATASELNSSHFDVQRSELNEAGSDMFETIGTLNAAGRSGSRLDYTLDDNSVEYGKTYVYRLRLVETDGSFEYSDERTIEVQGDIKVHVGNVEPNPISFQSKISVTLDGTAKVQADIYDMNGVKVLNVFDKDMSTGKIDMMLNAHQLVNGAYTIVIKIGDRIIRKSIRVVK